MESKPVVWLKIHSDKVALQETWEYKMRRSMISASVFLCLKSENHKLVATAEGSIKIPIKGRYGFKAQGDLLPDADRVSFSELLINPTLDKPRTQVWNALEKSIRFRDSESSSSSEFELGEKTFGHVLSALAVLPAIGHSWIGRNAEYRSIFVAGKRPTVLRMSALDSGTGTSEVRLRIESLNISEIFDFNEESWNALPWRSALVLEGVFDEARRELISIAAQAPLVGQVRLELNAHVIIPFARSP